MVFIPIASYLFEAFTAIAVVSTRGARAVHAGNRDTYASHLNYLYIISIIGAALFRRRRNLIEAAGRDQMKLEAKRYGLWRKQWRI